MVRDPTHLDVLRLPGAPPRRAGRTWPEGITVRVPVADLTDRQIAALWLDPGYRITHIDARTGEPSATAPGLIQPAPVDRPEGSPVRPSHRPYPVPAPAGELPRADLDAQSPTPAGGVEGAARGRGRKSARQAAR